MEKVTTCFTLSFTHEQYSDAMEYVRDMKKHPKRAFWIGKEHNSEEELVLTVIAHRILSGFYNVNNGRYGFAQILGMSNIPTA